MWSAFQTLHKKKKTTTTLSSKINYHNHYYNFRWYKCLNNNTLETLTLNFWQFGILWWFILYSWQVHYCYCVTQRLSGGELWHCLHTIAFISKYKPLQLFSQYNKTAKHYEENPNKQSHSALRGYQKTQTLMDLNTTNQGQRSSSITESTIAKQMEKTKGRCSTEEIWGYMRLSELVNLNS